MQQLVECPNCGSKNIGSEFNNEDGSIWYHNVCEDCGREWNEVWEYSFNEEPDCKKMQTLHIDDGSGTCDEFWMCNCGMVHRKEYVRKCHKCGAKHSEATDAPVSALLIKFPHLLDEHERAELYEWVATGKDNLR